MNNKKILQGGVIVSADQHTHAVVQLLTHHLQGRVQLTYYSHPNEIDKPIELLIVLSAADLEGSNKAYRTRQQPAPYFIYIDEPETLNGLDFAALYPGVEIAPVPHAVRSKGHDTTLQLDMFRTVIELLEARR